MARKRGKQDSVWRAQRWRVAAWSLVPLILLVPLVAMQVTPAVQWTAFDFVIAAILLSGTGAMFEVAVRMSRHAAYRVAAAIALATAFLLVWVNLAVGIIGDEHGANLLYLGVLLVGLGGVLRARFRPRGMALALAAMAGAQGLVAVVALGLGFWQAALVTLGFAALWLLSAGLFQKAARDAAAGAGR